MSSVFDAIRPTRARAIALAVAWAILASLACLLPLVLAGRSFDVPGVSIDIVELPRAGGSVADRGLLIAALLGATLFSWLLAERAVRSGWLAGLTVAIAFDLAAVGLGSFVVAGLASVEAGGDVGTFLASTLGLGLLGLVFLGIPMLALGLPLTVLWVIGLRTVVGLVARGQAVPEIG